MALGARDRPAGPPEPRFARIAGGGLGPVADDADRGDGHGAARLEMEAAPPGDADRLALGVAPRPVPIGYAVRLRGAALEARPVLLGRAALAGRRRGGAIEHPVAPRP